MMRHNQGRQNKALQQNRDDVLRYGESIGCDLLKAAVLSQEAQSQSQSRGAPIVPNRFVGIVDRIRDAHFAFPPAATADVAAAHARGVPAELLEFYECCDGALISPGDHFKNFLAPSGRRYRFRIPRLSEIQTARAFGYIPEWSPLLERASQWWQIVNYGDADWLAYDATPNSHGSIIDLFHETVGDPGWHSIVAASLLDLLDRLCDSGGVYWLADDFSPLGTI
jgi:hypothetical protein